MVIPDDDHYIEVSLALQLTQLDMYNKVLIERQKRKKYDNITTGRYCFTCYCSIVLLGSIIS